VDSRCRFRGTGPALTRKLHQGNAFTLPAIESSDRIPHPLPRQSDPAAAGPAWSRPPASIIAGLRRSSGRERERGPGTISESGKRDRCPSVLPASDPGRWVTRVPGLGGRRSRGDRGQVGYFRQPWRQRDRTRASTGSDSLHPSRAARTPFLLLRASLRAQVWSRVAQPGARKPSGNPRQQNLPPPPADPNSRTVA
jgi:hypothetical protein